LSTATRIEGLGANSDHDVRGAEPAEPHHGLLPRARRSLRHSARLSQPMGRDSRRFACVGTSTSHRHAVAPSSSSTKPRRLSPRSSASCAFSPARTSTPSSSSVSSLLVTRGCQSAFAPRTSSRALRRKRRRRRRQRDLHLATRERRLCDVEPWSYLRDVLCLLPRWPGHRLLELAPLSWKETSSLAEVRDLLDANAFRRLTLDTRGSSNRRTAGIRPRFRGRVLSNAYD